MDIVSKKESKEKSFVAASSVLAAVMLTSTKLIVGLLTGSLGILSEALHSGLDLVAAVVTLFAVKIADKPPDPDHHYGHGKIENLSALFETMLLIVTCAWIIYEAYERLNTGLTEFELSFWSYAVVIFSIIIDISRSRALKHTAIKYNSQALEADALHFSSDIFSSLVVLLGLIGASFGFHQADSIAALIVAMIVIGISIQLGKKSIDVLMDRSPAFLSEEIVQLSTQIPEVISVHDIKLRTSGSYIFAELNIHLDPKLSLERAHQISHEVEDKITSEMKRCRVHVHAEPDMINSNNIITNN